jgi:hypothetical protein
MWMQDCCWDQAEAGVVGCLIARDGSFGFNGEVEKFAERNLETKKLEDREDPGR